MVYHDPDFCEHSECDEDEKEIHGCDEDLTEECDGLCEEEDEDYDELFGRDDWKDYD